MKKAGFFAILLSTMVFGFTQQSSVYRYDCYTPGEAFSCRFDTKDGSLANWTFIDENGSIRVRNNTAVVYIDFVPGSVNTFTVVTATASDNGKVRCNNNSRCH